MDKPLEGSKDSPITITGSQDKTMSRMPECEGAGVEDVEGF